MRHTPEAIRQFLTEHPLSGQTVASFCEDRNLKVPTFYSWKKKYGQPEAPAQEGFYKIIPKQEIAQRSLRLPSGLRLELIGLSTTEIAEIILETGTFELPTAEKDTLEMSWTDIQLLLEGIEINSAKRRKRYVKAA